MEAITGSNLPYPTDDDPLSSWPGTLEALAMGLGSPVVLGVTPSAGWTLGVQRCYQLLGDLLIWLEIAVIRSGATVTLGADGNVTDIPVCSIDVEYRPVSNQYTAWITRAGTSRANLRIATSGAVDITDGQAGSAITSGASYVIHGLYIRKS